MANTMNYKTSNQQYGFVNIKLFNLIYAVFSSISIVFGSLTLRIAQSQTKVSQEPPAPVSNSQTNNSTQSVKSAKSSVGLVLPQPETLPTSNQFSQPLAPRKTLPLNNQKSNSNQNANNANNLTNNSSNHLSNNQGNNNTSPQTPWNHQSTPPKFQDSPKLQSIVDEILELVESRELSTKHLSVSLINLNPDASDACCEYAGYKDKVSRFPASISKLFWMAYLYGSRPDLLQSQQMQTAVRDMMQFSDNEAASFVVDKLTATESGGTLPENEFKQWYKRRLTLNQFFIKAGYQNINVSQKVFPNSYTKNYRSNNDLPVGRDLQIRTENINTEFIENHTTTSNAARLLMEIETGRLASPEHTRQMKKLLSRSLNREDWQGKQLSLAGFLGEGLPPSAKILSKMGWNSQTRNDAAIITSPDGKIKYVLAVFGDDSEYYQDTRVFPAISRLVYSRMVLNNNLSVY